MACRSVLIVEDEEFIRDNLKMLLEFEGYPVSTANNGEEGLKALRGMEHPCLVLLDLLMPVMNGLEFLEAKGKDDVIASIPVCVVSGVADRPIVSGIKAFIKKPIDFDGLLKFVRDYCGEPSQKRSS